MCCIAVLLNKITIKSMFVMWHFANENYYLNLHCFLMEIEIVMGIYSLHPIGGGKTIPIAMKMLTPCLRRVLNNWNNFRCLVAVA